MRREPNPLRAIRASLGKHLARSDVRSLPTIGDRVIEKLKKQFRNAGIFTGTSGDRLRDRIFTGHINIGPVTLYGANAMHYAINIRTDVGYLCARPTTERGYWKWYVYLSPNATPSAAYWGFGPGFNE